MSGHDTSATSPRVSGGVGRSGSDRRRRVPRAADDRAETPLRQGRALHLHLARRRRGADRYVGSEAAGRSESEEGRVVLPGDRHGDSRRAGLRASARGVRRCSTASSLVRTVHHEVIDEHAAAVNRMHTGRPTSGTIVYPSIGSIVAQQRGAAGEGVPAYVLIGYPNVTRGPGFLGAKHGYVYLTDTESGPAGLSRPLRDHRRPAGAPRGAAGEGSRRAISTGRSGDAFVEQYDATLGEALRLAGPQFKQIFQLDRGARQPARGLRRRIRPAVPARRGGWSRRACGSSRSRTT